MRSPVSRPYNVWTMGTSDVIRRKAAREWDRIMAHPFVCGLGDGSLPVDRFAFFLRQDYLFLIDYARVLAIAAAKAPDPHGMGHFADLLHETLATEMDLHRKYCAGFGITPRALERTRPVPGTVTYAKFLVSAAYEGSIAELTAALLPCMWSYSEIGVTLAKTGDLSDRNPYASWIKTYASDEFRALSDWLQSYLDHLAPRPSRRERQRLEELFLMSCRCELAFWEMGWTRQGWPREGR